MHAQAPTMYSILLCSLATSLLRALLFAQPVTADLAERLRTAVTIYVRRTKQFVIATFVQTICVIER